jgi:hypothetical protein
VLFGIGQNQPSNLAELTHFTFDFSHLLLYPTR